MVCGPLDANTGSGTGDRRRGRPGHIRGTREPRGAVDTSTPQTPAVPPALNPAEDRPADKEQTRARWSKFQIKVTLTFLCLPVL